MGCIGIPALSVSIATAFHLTFSSSLPPVYFHLLPKAPLLWPHLVPLCQSKAGMLFRYNPSFTLHQVITSESSSLCFQVASRRATWARTPPGQRLLVFLVERPRFRLEISRGSLSYHPIAPAAPVPSFLPRHPPLVATTPFLCEHASPTVVSYPQGRNHLGALLGVDHPARPPNSLLCVTFSMYSSAAASGFSSLFFSSVSLYS